MLQNTSALIEFLEFISPLPLGVLNSMAKSTYKSDTLVKKLHRFGFWLQTHVMLGERRFFSCKHLVLASRDGGDVSCLLGMGVPPKNIVAVDHDPEATASVQSKFPGVRVVTADIVRVARQNHRQFCSAYLDFCGIFSSKTLHTIADVIRHGLATDGIVGCTLFGGRERGTVKQLIDICRMVSSDLPTANDGEDAMVYRIWLINHFLQNELIPSGSYVDMFSFGRYLSLSPSGKTSPMLTFQARVHRSSSSRKVIRNKADRMHEIRMEDMTDNHRLSADGLRNGRGLVTYNYENTSANDLICQLVKMANDIVSSGIPNVNPAQILNISPRTLAAWRAHVTRGTYAQTG